MNGSFKIIFTWQMLVSKYRSIYFTVNC